MKINKRGRIRLANYGSRSKSKDVLTQMNEIVQFSQRADRYFRNQGILNPEQSIIQKKSNINLIGKPQSFPLTQFEQTEYHVQQSQSQIQIENDYRKVIEGFSKDELQHMLLLKFQNNMQLLQKQTKTKGIADRESSQRPFLFHRTFTHLILKRNMQRSEEGSPNQVVQVENVAKVQSVSPTLVQTNHHKLLSRFLHRNKLQSLNEVASKGIENQKSLATKGKLIKPIQPSKPKQISSRSISYPKVEDLPRQKQNAIRKLEQIQQCAASITYKGKNKKFNTTSNQAKLSGITQLTENNFLTTNGLHLIDQTHSNIFQNFGYDLRQQSERSFSYRDKPKTERKRQSSVQPMLQRQASCFSVQSYAVDLNRQKYGDMKRQLKIIRMNQKLYVKKLDPYTREKLESNIT